MMDAAEILSSARRRYARIGQPELSKRTGIAQATISRYEAGRQNPPFRTLIRLLEGCGYRVTLRLEPIEEPEVVEFTA